MRDKNYPVEIPSLPHMRVDISPYGGDVLLIVERGIPCESHAEVFSAHVTNCPDLEDIRDALKGLDASIKASYDSFIALVNSIPKRVRFNERKLRFKNWDVVNRIGEAYFKELVMVIAMEGEDIGIQKHEAHIREILDPAVEHTHDIRDACYGCGSAGRCGTCCPECNPPKD